MKRIYRTPGFSGGFSLIEVMIAVVVLATGLMALAALQASLTRSSAEAKTRSRVAAMLSARMEALRGSGYDNTVLDPGDSTTTSTVDGCDGDATDWADCARAQANLGWLQVTQTTTLWTSDIGATSFTEVDDRADVESGDPEFIRVTLQAEWTGTGEPTTAPKHKLAMTSEFSSLALRDSLLPPPPGSTTSTGSPVVRTDNPAGPGVIPIAVGGGDATAASNPRPEQVGKSQNTNVTGTRFDVLTYNGLTGAAVIQRRVETAVIKCQCRLGAGGTNLPEIYRASQWPAVWTGERYDVYTPSPAAAAPGQGKNSGPKPNVTQSPLCQECCRDHFDGTTSGVAKFDPERTGAHDHYAANGAVLTALATNDVDYVESCRVIRVDGFWRTAADTYSRQFGLLATQTLNGKEAANGIPDDTDPVKTATNYQTFVKDYLKQINGTSVIAPTNAQALFDETARQLNEPADVDIATPNAADIRYLHGRGLYLDYLEVKARKKIEAILADNGPAGACPTGSDVAECILPFLPFTTINVTELAKWSVTDDDILSVNSGNQLENTVGDADLAATLPSGGATQGIAKGVADDVAKIGRSNFGLAASEDPFYKNVTGVDPGDTATYTDTQRFDVGGDNSPPSSGDRFTVAFTGLTTHDPDVSHSIGGTPIPCLSSSGAAGPYQCATNASPLSGGTVKISNYQIGPLQISQTRNYTCGNKSGNFTVKVPTFYNFSASASIGGVAGSPNLQSSNKIAEYTEFTFGAELKANAVVDVVISAEGPGQEATVASCKITGSGNNASIDITWNEPWK